MLLSLFPIIRILLGFFCRSSGSGDQDVDMEPAKSSSQVRGQGKLPFRIDSLQDEFTVSFCLARAVIALEETSEIFIQTQGFTRQPTVELVSLWYSAA